MTQTHTSTNIRVENGTAIVTETTYDENDQPLEGVTREITEEEAEALMATKSDKNAMDTTVDTSKETTPIDNNTVTDQELQEQNAQLGVQDGVEKPASQMTEADAVALNSDVHLATPAQSPRVVTQGQVDQVDTGLHPDAREGKPLIKEDDDTQQEQNQTTEDLHVRAPSK